MKLIATSIICACVISTGVGFAFGQASDPPAADAASSQARVLGQINGQLRKLNTTAAYISSDTEHLSADGVLSGGGGTPYSHGTPLSQLLADICQKLDGSSNGCH